MSYSFSVRAASKAEAKEKIGAEFDKIVAGQAVHATDRSTAQDVAETFVDFMVEPDEGKEISVSVNGYLSWRAEGEFTGASVSVTASVINPA